MVDFRRKIAKRFSDNVRISRATIFGAADPRPISLVEDAETMFAGYVGPRYAQGGVVLLAINPGGGGDAYQRRTAQDEKLYPLLRKFKSATDTEALKRFEEINGVFPNMLRRWNVWRIVEPCLEAAGVTVDQAAYLNAVPYRTRGDAMPPIAARRRAWEQITGPTLDILDPRDIIALGKKAGDVLRGFYKGPVRQWVVPRTNGDRYVSEAADKVLKKIEEARGSAC